MNFGTAFVSFWKNYANFNGRARRSEYWFAALSIGLISVGVSLVSTNVDYYGHVSYGPLYWIWVLAIFVPSLAIVSRRLHDIGRSFGYYFIALIPLVGAILLLVALATDGNAGPNKYGEPVK